MKKAIAILIILIIVAGLIYLGIEAYKTIMTTDSEPVSLPDQIIYEQEQEPTQEEPVDEPEFFYALNPETEECEQFSDIADMPEGWEACVPKDEEKDVEKEQAEDNEEGEEEEETMEDISLPLVQEGQVIVFYTKEGETDCSKVYPLVRDIKESYLDQEYIEIQALLMLLVPLTSEEKARGFENAIPYGTRLRNLSISGDSIGTAIFNQTLNEGGGSCMMSARRAQIEQTLLQFEDISKVIIKAGEEGEETTLQP